MMKLKGRKMKMKRKMSLGKQIIKAVAAATLVMSMGLTAFAAEDAENLQMEIDGTIIDIGQLAKKNDVNPYELKAAIEESIDADVVSLFSSLATNTPNTMASESTELVWGRAATGARGNVKVNKKNQDSTAYVAKAGQVTANGKTPEVGMCAMYIKSTTKTGSTSSSKVKLGTTIYMDSAVDVNGTSLSSFVVEDRGNPDNRTDFWIDIFFGQYVDTNSATYKAAINYGIKTVSYYYYY